MQETKYWKIKREESERIFRGLSEGKFPGQPPVVEFVNDYGNPDAEVTKENSFLYVVSLKNFDKNSVPGKVSLATLHNASRGLADGTHAVATKEQIAGFEATQAANKKKTDEINWAAAAKKEIIREIIREVPVPAPADEKKK